ncbi:MAG: endonuclease domain-containing protein [Gammaproteobacteria bacterium]|nr:endonuclease domain-containing protein [Gammaproteobacteria bacterium]
MDVRRARNLRKNSTDAERLLWRHLRDRQLQGYKFRRQQTIGPYIVDFICLEQRLIVEVDGGQHQQQGEYDDRRTRWLEDEGYRIIRFWNHDVLSNIDSVLTQISAALQNTVAC